MNILEGIRERKEYYLIGRWYRAIMRDKNRGFVRIPGVKSKKEDVKSGKCKLKKNAIAPKYNRQGLEREH
ncbi:MAG: hypothetical protein U0264_01935 [Candidatus Kapaibacterium sp.]